MISSSLSLFLLYIYRGLGKRYIKPADIQENKVIKVASKVGFGGNIALFLFCILILFGFGIMP